MRRDYKYFDFVVALFVTVLILSNLLSSAKVITKGRWIWTRTIAGEGVDSVVFFLIACTLGVFPWALYWLLVVTNYIFKVGIEVVFTSVTLRIIKALKRAENEDVYDTDTDFSPFRLDV